MAAAVFRLGPLAFSGWDVLLVVAVSLHATALAFVPQPRMKAFLLTLPIPFTVASLSLGRPVSAGHVLGLVLLLGYTAAVYALRVRARVPIVAAIVLAVAGYCGAATALAPWLPPTDGAFWLAAAGVAALGAVLLRLLPHRAEPSHRSPLPVALKLPLVALVVIGLVILKQSLQGFMTVFPMVGVIASYEGRHCLWTLTRQIPVIMLTLLPLMMTERLLLPVVGMGWALVAGWVVFLAVLTVVTAHDWRRQSQPPLPPHK